MSFPQSEIERRDVAGDDPELFVDIGLVSNECDLEGGDSRMDLDGKKVRNPDEVAVDHHARARRLRGNGDISDEPVFLVLEIVDDPGRQEFRIERVARIVQQELPEIIRRALEIASVEKSPRAMLVGFLL